VKVVKNVNRRERKQRFERGLFWAFSEEAKGALCLRSSQRNLHEVSITKSEERGIGKRPSGN